jgi:hypothetical protein
MTRGLLLTVSLTLWAQLSGAAPPDPANWTRPAGWTTMTARIDDLLAQRWAQEGVRPAPKASDGEFLRRATLDLTGLIPTVQEVRAFLADTSRHKRFELVERLLAKPNHATHFANIWRHVMLPADSNLAQFGGDAGFQLWLRSQFADNVPYHKMVTALLVTSGNTQGTGPGLFYSALQLKPEELAASTSRIFLGVQIQCAQCHNHPFAPWTRKDFWGYAAFFGRLRQPARGQQFVFQIHEGHVGEVKIPDTDEVIAPKFLGGPESPDDVLQLRRARLAAWLTSGNNEYFAKAAVNRVWAVLFGRGLVQPVDDLGDHNPPSHPELLDELAKYFAETGFDVRNLVRTLTATLAYQLSSQSEAGAPDRPELFARMAIKSLSADQLYDCLTEAMRRRSNVAGGNQMAGFRGFDGGRQSFLAKFRAPTQGATDYESGIPQALTLMNGRVVREATDVANSDILIALDAPFFNDEERVETLFLSTLSRLPGDDERAKFVAYAKKGAGAKERRKALSDILWALLNSAEFALNH